MMQRVTFSDSIWYYKLVLRDPILNRKLSGILRVLKGDVNVNCKARPSGFIALSGRCPASAPASSWPTLLPPAARRYDSVSLKLRMLLPKHFA